MKTKSILIFLLAVQSSFACLSQIVLSTAASNNSSGGVFLRLTANSTPINLLKFNTVFASANGTPASVELYSRSGDYTGFTASNAGWTLLGTINTVSAGITTNAPLDISALNVQVPASSVMSFYLHGVTVGGGLRYTGTASIPPVTSFADANVTLFSNVARTGNVAFAGTSFSPRTFSGSIEYTLGVVPVTWIETSARNYHGMAEISWTVTESSSHSYTLERQENAGYKIITVVSSNGNGVHSYSATDPDPFTPDKKTAWYRIMQKDINGHINYSPILPVKNMNSTNSLSIYPNPVVDNTQIFTPVSQTVAVYTLSGRMIRSMKLNKGVNTIDTRDWLPGTYLVKTGNGETVKLIKQ